MERDELGRFPKLNYEEIKNNIEQYNYYLLSLDVKNSKQKLIIKDKLDYLYYVSYNSLTQNHIPYKFGRNNPYTIDNIKLWCKLNNKPFELISNKYEGSSKKLKWQCLNCSCKEIFESSWNNIQNGKGCGYCAGQKVGLSNCLANKNPELSAEWHPTKNGNLTPYDFSQCSGEYAWWQCNKNQKHEWYTAISLRVHGKTGCPYCAGLLPWEEYNLLVCNPELCKEWDYNKNEKNPEEYCPNANQYAWWICSKCGNNWYAHIANRNKGSCCPKCNESKGETSISVILKERNINNIPQYIFEDCRNIRPLEFDFYLPKYNVCIEYQGIQHYEPVDFAGKGQEWAEKLFNENQRKDQIKRDYCNKNNIRLIEIPYWNFYNIEEILRVNQIIL